MCRVSVFSWIIFNNTQRVIGKWLSSSCTERRVESAAAWHFMNVIPVQPQPRCRCTCNNVKGGAYDARILNKYRNLIHLWLLFIRIGECLFQSIILPTLPFQLNHCSSQRSMSNLLSLYDCTRSDAYTYLNSSYFILIINYWNNFCVPVNGYVLFKNILCGRFPSKYIFLCCCSTLCLPGAYRFKEHTGGRFPAAARTYLNFGCF